MKDRWPYWGEVRVDGQGEMIGNVDVSRSMEHGREAAIHLKLV